MDFSKNEIIEHLSESFIKRAMQRAEKGEEEMRKYIDEMIQTFKQKIGIDDKSAVVFHYVLSMLFSAMTEIETLQAIIRQLVENSD
jgi:hypothetical protein